MERVLRCLSGVGDLARLGKLGLAGMQERVQLLGGVLNIQSQVGKGTQCLGRNTGIELEGLKINIAPLSPERGVKLLSIILNI